MTATNRAPRVARATPHRLGEPGGRPVRAFIFGITTRAGSPGRERSPAHRPRHRRSGARRWRGRRSPDTTRNEHSRIPPRQRKRVSERRSATGRQILERAYRVVGRARRLQQDLRGRAATGNHHDFVVPSGRLGKQSAAAPFTKRIRSCTACEPLESTTKMKRVPPVAANLLVQIVGPHASRSPVCVTACTQRRADVELARGNQSAGRGSPGLADAVGSRRLSRRDCACSTTILGRGHRAAQRPLAIVAPAILVFRWLRCVVALSGGGGVLGFRG